MLVEFQDLDEGFEYVFRGLHEKDDAQFPLFKLPAELWLKVLEHAVTQPRTIDVTRAREPRHQAQIVKQPAITRTTRLLRKEALPLFYRCNDFEIYHWGGTACIRDWLLAIGPDNLKHMGTLTFHAKFEASFWKTKLTEIGIPANVTVAETQTSIKQRPDFQSLTVTFL